MDSKDFLESSVLLNESQYQEGYKDGFNDGMLSGKDEGKDVGLKHGFQVGEEIGFYQGCLDIWTSAIKLDPNTFSSRVQKRIEQLQDLVTNYPLLDPENEQLQDMMEAIRLKLRIISANLGLSSTLTYEGHPKSSHQDLETI